MRLNPMRGLIFLLAAAHAPFASGDDQVTIAAGVVEGTTAPDGIRVFKGIPFAEPPVGELRWKPPQPLKPWEGVKKTQAFGPSPTQNPALAVMMNVPGTFSE